MSPAEVLVPQLKRWVGFEGANFSDELTPENLAEWAIY